MWKYVIPGVSALAVLDAAANPGPSTPAPSFGSTWSLFADRRFPGPLDGNLFATTVPYESSLTYSDGMAFLYGTNLKYYFSRGRTGFHAGLKLGLGLSPTPGLDYFVVPALGYDFAITRKLTLGIEGSSIRYLRGNSSNVLLLQLKCDLD